MSYPLSDADNIYLKDTTNINGRLSQSGSILEDGNINRYSFGAGIEVAKGIYVGGSLNYLSGKYETIVNTTKTIGMDIILHLLI